MTASSDPRAQRLRGVAALLLVPAGPVVAFDAAFLFGSGWQMHSVATAVVAAALAGLSLLAVCVARGLDVAAHRRDLATRAAAAALAPLLVPTPPRPAPVRTVSAQPAVSVETPPPAGPGPLRPELVARPAVRVVTPRTTPEPHPVGYSP